METLDKTEWDVVIVGTGLQQSLLALALSRSEKKILHIDKNGYYGGAEAALSLDEAREWLQRMNGNASSTAFSNVTLTTPDVAADSSSNPPALSFSRSYSLALSPQLIYTRSSLLQHLVSSRVYRQLEFLAVGSWWIYSPQSDESPYYGKLLKVPNGREDIFQNDELDFKAKRALIKFLRFIGEYEEQTDIWEEYRKKPFSAFLFEQFKIPLSLQAPILALTLSKSNSNNTTTEQALQRVARHLRSIGVFGTRSGAVILKWGGLSEVNQVACRACAVGGGVYVLGKDVSSSQDGSSMKQGHTIRLKDGEVITTQWIIGGQTSANETEAICKSVTIISTPLTPLFPAPTEDTPASAAALVVFPSGSLSLDPSNEDHPPIYVLVHSSDTGECPASQCILYASVSISSEQGFSLLSKAVELLLASVDATPQPSILWSIKYQQQPSSGTETLPAGDHVLCFPPPPLEVAFEDTILDSVKEVWQKITDNDGDQFLQFQDREAYDEDDE